MALAAYSFATLAEAKAFLIATGTAKDSQLELALMQASRALEAYLGRRIVYRAPPEVDGAANIVASVTLANGSLTVAAQPGSGGRTLIVTVTDTDRSLTAGQLVVTGTVGGVAGTTETFDLAAGVPQHGVKFFTAISGAVVSGLAGHGAGDVVKVGSSEGYVEYHSPCEQLIVSLLEWPIQQIRDVNEDPGRAYATSTQLVAATDYIAQKGNGFLIRQSFPSPMSWSDGWRAVRAVYSGGYYGQANVPADLKGACLRLTGLLYDETQKGRLGVSSMADAVGNWTRFGPASLTQELREAVASHKRWMGPFTGERDFDLEAA